MRGVTLVLSSHLNPFDHIVVFQGVELNIFAMKDREREKIQKMFRTPAPILAPVTLCTSVSLLAWRMTLSEAQRSAVHGRAFFDMETWGFA
jgi:hypothetical protein